MEVDAFQDINHRGREHLGEGEGGVVLGVASDLQNALAELGKGGGEVRGGGALADAALAIDGEHLGGSDAKIGVHLDLDAALAV